MLGDSNGRHLQLDGLIEHFVDAASSIEQRELGMKMQVDEIWHYSHSIVEGGFELMS